MHCRTCANSVSDKAVICVKCGVPPLTGNEFCQECGAETNAAATVCLKCGVAIKSQCKSKSVVRDGEVIYASDPPKDPLLMAMLSGCCIAWLSQIIMGQKTKGTVLLIGSMLACISTIGAAIVVIYPLAAIDAYLIAKKLKNGVGVKEWEFF